MYFLEIAEVAKRRGYLSSYIVVVDPQLGQGREIPYRGRNSASQTSDLEDQLGDPAVADLNMIPTVDSAAAWGAPG